MTDGKGKDNNWPKPRCEARPRRRHGGRLSPPGPVASRGFRSAGRKRTWRSRRPRGRRRHPTSRQRSPCRTGRLKSPPAGAGTAAVRRSPFASTASSKGAGAFVKQTAMTAWPPGGTSPAGAVRHQSGIGGAPFLRLSGGSAGSATPSSERFESASGAPVPFSTKTSTVRAFEPVDVRH